MIVRPTKLAKIANAQSKVGKHQLQLFTCLYLLVAEVKIIKLRNLYSKIIFTCVRHLLNTF